MRAPVLAALGVLALNLVGTGVSLATGVGCEFDCAGSIPNPLLSAVLLGTAYNAPWPFLLVIALGAVLASRARRGLVIAGFALVGVAGAINGLAIVGEPWAQRALAAPDAMTLVLAVMLVGALAMLATGSWAAIGAVRRGA